MDIVFLIIGLMLLIAGGEALVQGAVAISDRLKVPPLLVGLTVVALGTSAPELTVAVGAALRDAPAIAVGSVVGSNIANILLVLGAAAAIQPVHAAMKVVHRDGFLLLVATSFLVGIALIGLISPVLGGFMILAFAGYTLYSYWRERVEARRLAHDTAAELASEEVEIHRGLSTKLYVCIPVFVAGCAALIMGADLLVEAAINIARGFGISEAVIGLSMVAIGTSLPELVISIMAACRGHSDVALGNVIGSNLSNILVILGVTSLVSPIPIEGQLQYFDVWVMLAATVILIPVLVTGRSVSRFEGMSFLVAYVVYMAALYLEVPALLFNWFNGA
jgi:cation:H+ antiporter